MILNSIHVIFYKFYNHGYYVVNMLFDDRNNLGSVLMSQYVCKCVWIETMNIKINKSDSYDLHKCATRRIIWKRAVKTLDMTTKYYQILKIYDTSQTWTIFNSLMQDTFLRKTTHTWKWIFMQALQKILQPSWFWHFF